jgi:signal transduction histidine kinase
MRLTDLHRTTSFRLSMSFLGLFGLCSLCLFGFVYGQTAHFVRGEQDAWLAREMASFTDLSPQERAQRLAAHARSDDGSLRPFGEFDASGHLIAGDLQHLPPLLMATGGPVDFFLQRDGHRLRHRGVATRMADGHWLAVSQDIHEPREFQERLISAMLAAGALTLLIGIGGAVAVGASSLRQIDGTTRAIRRIVTGDLSERLPVRRGADDVNRLAIAVNGMLEDIERLMQEVKGACDGIAHDLRTPLTHVFSGLERALRRAERPQDYRQAIEQAMADIQDLLRTFNAMLRISEIEAGARRSGFVAVDPRRLLNDLVELYLPLAEERGIALTLLDRSSIRPIVMLGDPSLLFDAIGNLIDNAVKFTPPGGRIVITLDSGNAGHRIAVADTGPGIPRNERTAVLQRFYRTEPSRSTPGNGLGLSLVAAIARIHDIALSFGHRDEAGGLVATLAWRDQPAPAA